MVLSYLRKLSSTDSLESSSAAGAAGVTTSSDRTKESDTNTTDTAGTTATISTTMTIDLPEEFVPIPSPPAPDQELPDRFLKAGKGDPIEGQRRYEATLKWRGENNIDTCLQRPHPTFHLIKSNYPHYYHMRGKQNEPVYIEQPPKANMKAMRSGGVTLDDNLQYYAMITEFQWQYIERSDSAASITILDMDGLGMLDFAGEIVTYVRATTKFTGQHYPERAGYVLIINVPGWFKMIWDVVKPLIDEVTLAKISIIGRSPDKVLKALQERIPMENIPQEYGGTSIFKLGESPEEYKLKALMKHNIDLMANGDMSCGGRNNHCEFCSFVPARSY